MTSQDERILRTLDLFAFSFYLGCSAIILIPCWVYAHWPISLGPGFLAACAAMLVLLHLALVSRRVSSVDPVVWIPLAFLAFYFGMPIARSLGATGPYAAWPVPPTPNLARGFGAALLTLTAFIAGMYLHGIQDRRQPIRASWPQSSHLRWAGLIVLFVGAVSMLIGFVLTGPSVVLADYGEVFERKATDADFRLFDVGMILIKAGVVGVLAAHRPGNRATGLALVAALFVAALSARLGSRGGLMSFGFAVAWVYSQRIRRIPTTWVAIGSLLAVFLLPGIKEYREWRSMRGTLELNPIEASAATLFETGTSVLSFGYTLDFIPSEKGYGWGVSYWRSLLHLVPNLGLTPGKSFLPDVLVSSPSHWLTSRIHPERYEQGGGYGYSVGAEWYFNFGYPGILAGMILMGYVLCYFRETAHRGPLWLVWSAFMFSMAGLIVRNILGAPLKSAVWSFAALWLADSVLRVVFKPASIQVASQGVDDRPPHVA